MSTQIGNLIIQNKFSSASTALDSARCIRSDKSRVQIRFD